MGGSSGSGFYPRKRPGNPVDINAYLRDRLREYNDRDTEAIRRHINGLRDALEQDDDVIRPLFGGSLSRHTYVDGLSDVDVLMVINDSTLAGQSPKAAIKHMADLIQRRMPNSDVSAGQMAVTIKYSDGIEVQVLPAVKTKSGLRVPEPRQNSWSRIVHPAKFAKRLTEVNQANGGRVVPTVKLIKALANRSAQSDDGRLSGYHTESLAIEAFKNYHGPNDLKSMIERFTSFGSKAVLQPIRDSSGQSRFVDEYLGLQGSPQRQRAARNLRAINRSLDECRSKRDLDNLFGS